MTRVRWTAAVQAVLVLATAAGAARGEGVPATVDEAARALDLANLTLIDGADAPGRRTVAGLSYEAPAPVRKAFDFHRQQLLGLKWGELPGTNVTDEYATGVFERDGFRASLTVMPGGKPDRANVTVTPHGNVDLASVPVPDGAKVLYRFPITVAYVTEAAVKETASACAARLAAAGWQPYGAAGDSRYYKQNAVRLTATVQSAPGQGGKTVVSYFTELLSVDLPAPPDADELQLNEVATDLRFETARTPADVAAFYRTALAQAGWKPTTDAPVRIDGDDVVVFRNGAKDVLMLATRTADGKTRVKLDLQTAAELAAMRETAEKAAAKRMAKTAAGVTASLDVPVPADAADVTAAAGKIGFNLAGGKARGVVEGWRKRLAADGWKEEVATVEDLAGGLTFTKGDARLTVTYTDTGFLPAEVEINAAGVTLRRAAPK